jgi:hypothetical protein
MAWSGIAARVGGAADADAVVDDLATLTKLDNAILVEQLRRRYADSKIYVRRAATKARGRESCR